MAFATSMRSLLRYLLYFFLATLPFNFQALIAGGLFAKFHNDSVSTGIELFLREMDSQSWMDQWSVPGAPSIWEFQDNNYPFYVKRVRTNDWREKLGLSTPHAHEEEFAVDAPIDKLVAFNGAVRDLTSCSHQPTEYWIYVSSLSMPEVYEWDQAFVQLLEYHARHPIPAEMLTIDCASNPMLCHIWQVHYPALIHVKTNMTGRVADDVDPEAFPTPLERLRPVEWRIFDLGLQYDVSPLPPGVFPSEFEQMKALTSNEGAYTIEEDDANDDIMWEFQRRYHLFNEQYYFPACNRAGSLLDYTSEFDNFLLKHVARPVGLESAVERMNGQAFLTSMTVAFAFYAVANPISDFWNNFLGKRTEVDELAQSLEEREAFGEGGGLLGGLHNGFMDWLEDHLEGSASESAERPLITSEKDDTKSMIADFKASMRNNFGPRD